jgi:acyl transferase domain-containing protein
VQLDWIRPDIYLENTDELDSNDEPDFRLISEHTRRPVFFQRAIERRLPSSLSAPGLRPVVGHQSFPDSKGHTFYSPQLTSANAQDSLTYVTVNLWKSGYATQFWPFHRSQKLYYEYLSLPPIPFEETRHWLGFTGRNAMAGNAAMEPATDAQETHELLAFLTCKDASKNGAVFQIDPQADRFQQMLGGHVMAGQCLAPASLYFELAARPALFLENDTQTTTYVPTVDDLLMKSLNGQSTTKRITLVLKKLADCCPLWSFSITTQDMEVHKAEPSEHSTGWVCLKNRDDVQAAREFERFETLTGHR